MLNDIIEDWISECMALHELNILDTQPGYKGDLHDISEFFVTIGWQWYLDAYGVDGLYVEQHNDHFMKWCGAGLAAAGVLMGSLGTAYIGYRLKPEIADLCLPSTYRLFTKAFWDTAEVEQPIPLERNKDMRRGDIVTIGKSKSYGSHITMVLSTHLTHFRTIEFNATGQTFSEGIKEGIVTKKHRYSEAVKIYRPTMDWFEEAS